MLDQIEKAYPETTEVGIIQLDGDSYNTKYPTIVRNIVKSKLDFYSKEEDKKEFNDAVILVNQFLDKEFAKCSKKIDQSTTDKITVVTTIKIDSTCTITSFGKLLISNYINEVLFITEDRSERYSSLRYNLVFQTKKQADQVRIANLLNQRPETLKINGIFESNFGESKINYYQENFSLQSDIINIASYIEKQNPKGIMYSPVELTFIKTGGDCPAGCTEATEWYIKATPEKIVQPGKYQFKIELVKKTKW